MEPETKIDEPIETVRAPRARWRRIVRRILKYSLVSCLIFAMALTVFVWIQSSKTSYYCTILLGDNNQVLLTSYKYRILFGVLNRNTPRNIVVTKKGVRFGSTPTEPAGVLAEKLTPPPSKIGVGIITRMEYSDPEAVIRGLSTRVMVAYDGLGVVMPYCFALLILGSILTFVLMGRRFSLRAFLIWVTIVCVILAIAVRTSGDSSQNQDRSAQDGT